jgi:hypothetical protein
MIELPFIEMGRNMSSSSERDSAEIRELAI